MRMCVAQRKADRRGRTWCVKVEVCTYEPLLEVSRHFTKEQAIAAMNRIA